MFLLCVLCVLCGFGNSIYYLFSFSALYKPKNDYNYHHCYNDIADFVTVFGGHYIDIVSRFGVCKTGKSGIEQS